VLVLGTLFKILFAKVCLLLCANFKHHWSKLLGVMGVQPFKMCKCKLLSAVIFVVSLSSVHKSELVVMFMCFVYSYIVAARVQALRDCGTPYIHAIFRFVLLWYLVFHAQEVLKMCPACKKDFGNTWILNGCLFLLGKHCKEGNLEVWACERLQRRCP